jgi:hypothetical protein
MLDQLSEYFVLEEHQRGHGWLHFILSLTLPLHFIKLSLLCPWEARESEVAQEFPIQRIFQDEIGLTVVLE